MNSKAIGLVAAVVVGTTVAVASATEAGDEPAGTETVDPGAPATPCDGAYALPDPDALAVPLLLSPTFAQAADPFPSAVIRDDLIRSVRSANTPTGLIAALGDAETSDDAALGLLHLVFSEGSLGLAQQGVCLETIGRLSPARGPTLLSLAYSELDEIVWRDTAGAFDVPLDDAPEDVVQATYDRFRASLAARIAKGLHASTDADGEAVLLELLASPYPSVRRTAIDSLASAPGFPRAAEVQTATDAIADPSEKQWMQQVLPKP